MKYIKNITSIHDVRLNGICAKQHPIIVLQRKKTPKFLISA